MNNPLWPSSNLLVVTPSNTVNFSSPVRQLYVGTEGNISVFTDDNQTVLFKNVSSGSVIGPFFIKRVNLTNTTALDIIAFV